MLLRITLNRWFATEDGKFPNVQEIRMPDDLGLGKVLTWYAKEGDTIKYDDVYVDIETSDFAFGMSHDEEESVTMLEIVAQVGDKVESGGLLCKLLRDEGNAQEEKSAPSADIDNDEYEKK
jgi:pyruvate/2-oxoglutarate dehydrogenase complex dihydrolipoamide acyltransferase (E2) component